MGGEESPLVCSESLKGCGWTLVLLRCAHPLSKFLLRRQIETQRSAPSRTRSMQNESSTKLPPRHDFPRLGRIRSFHLRYRMHRRWLHASLNIRWSYGIGSWHQKKDRQEIQYLEALTRCSKASATLPSAQGRNEGATDTYPGLEGSQEGGMHFTRGYLR